MYSVSFLTGLYLSKRYGVTQHCMVVPLKLKHSVLPMSYADPDLLRCFRSYSPTTRLAAWKLWQKISPGNLAALLPISMNATQVQLDWDSMPSKIMPDVKYFPKLNLRSSWERTKVWGKNWSFFLACRISAGRNIRLKNGLKSHTNATGAFYLMLHLLWQRRLWIFRKFLQISLRFRSTKFLVTQQVTRIVNSSFKTAVQYCWCFDGGDYKMSGYLRYVQAI